jgi:phosphosulfolactate phosphohydrolase-like enzyme
LSVYRQSKLPDALLQCRVGRMLAKRGLAHEVEFAGRLDELPVVPALQDGRLRLLGVERDLQP